MTDLDSRAEASQHDSQSDSTYLAWFPTARKELDVETMRAEWSMQSSGVHINKP